jgi:thymidine kinase
MKTYGELKLITGPMFAGKSTELLKEYIYRQVFSQETSGQCPIYYPGIDHRWEHGRIETHEGNGVHAVPFTRLPRIRPGVDTMFFDEVQFLEGAVIEGDFIEYVSKARFAGINFVCAGLNLDYAGRPFRITSELMAMASNIVALKATCCQCSAAATHSARLDESQEKIVTGDAEQYAPMCADHWQTHMLSVDAEP